jgi:monoamine oxidase
VWTEDKREAHFRDLWEFDGRVVVAGEAVAAAVGGWQEGAILSALDVTQRLHQKVHAG